MPVRLRDQLGVDVGIQSKDILKRFLAITERLAVMAKMLVLVAHSFGLRYSARLPQTTRRFEHKIFNSLAVKGKWNVSPS